MQDGTFFNNSARWGGAHVGFSVLPTPSLAHDFCDDCSFEDLPLQPDVYQTSDGFATCM